MIQTWLPLPSFADSVSVLSDEHLDIQRVHVLELLEYFHEPEVSQLPFFYEGHELNPQSPIVLMWVGYELQLAEYGLQACEEQALRKDKDDPFFAKINKHMEWALNDDSVLSKPNWFGNVDFHLSHQAELLREDRRHYEQHFLHDGDREMIWPKSDYRAAS